MFKTLTLVSTFLISALAQEPAGDELEPVEKKHPIEVEMAKALVENNSTAGMVEAFATASEKWEAEMTKNYKILLKGLDSDAAKALREAQAAWVTQRDKEIDYLIEFYAKMKGTMYRVIYAETTMSMVRRRAIALGHMVEMLERRETGE